MVKPHSNILQISRSGGKTPYTAIVRQPNVQADTDMWYNCRVTNMRYYREVKGLTQTRLSKLTGIPQGKISAAEKGKHRFNYERTLMLSRILLPDHLDPESLYEKHDG